MIPWWWRLGVLGLAIVGFWAYGFYQFRAGKVEVQRAWDLSAEIDKAMIDNLQVQQEKVTVRTVVEYVDRVKTVKEKGDTIVKKIPVYIPARDNCQLPGGFRLLHDSAAIGSPLPGSSNGINAASVGVAEAARTIAGNYSSCHITAARLIALQEWVRGQQALQPGELENNKQQ